MKWNLTFNNNLYKKYCKLVRADRPGNWKRGGVDVYFKEPLRPICLPNPYLKECIIIEVSINNKIICVVWMYKSESEISNDFTSFSANLE